MTKKFSVTCDFGDICDKTVKVEADTVEQAIKLALEDEDDFNSSGYAGDTYVSRIVDEDGTEIAVPLRYAGEDSQMHALKDVLSNLVGMYHVTNNPYWDAGKELLEQINGEDFFEALLPDGTRAPWDERLVAAGASRVPKERTK